MVRFTVSLRQGAVLDPPGRSGALSLMMELLLRGTKARTRRLFHTALETLGSSLDVAVGQEQAYMTGTALKRHLPAAIELLTEAWLTPQFAPDELEHLKEETQQSLLRERDDDDALADYYTRQALYQDHPLGRAPEGCGEDLARISLDDIHAAYKALRADDLIIGVVGDIDAAHAEALFAPLVQKLGQGAGAKVQFPPVAQPEGLCITVVDKPERTQVQLRLARLGLDAYHKDVDAFWLGIMAFGGTFTSPLTRQVRDERGWSYFAQADFRRRAAFAAPVVLRCAPAIEDAVPCLALNVALYQQLATGQLALADLRLARDYVLNRYPFDIATAYDVIGPAVGLERLGLPAARLWDLPERLSALDLAAVPELMATHLNPAHCVAVLVGAADTLVPQIKAALPAAQLRVVDFRDGLGLSSGP
jgi:zinc protease